MANNFPLVPAFRLRRLLASALEAKSPRSATVGLWRARRRGV